MAQRYGEDIAAFNKNWHASFGRFSDVQTAVLKAETQEAREDMAAFEEILHALVVDVGSADLAIVRLCGGG